jgi:enamidase
MSRPGGLWLAAFAIGLFLPSGMAAAQAQSVTAITGVRLIDGTGAAPLENATIVMRDGLIVATGRAASVAVPEGAERIDGSGRTAIPGLIDAHVHLGATVVAGLGEFAPAMLQQFLSHGVTTVRSVGDVTPWVLDLRAGIRSGAVVGPRLIAAGPMFTAPGGHPAGTWLRQMPEVAPLLSRQMTNADSAILEVRRLAAAGVDLIKAVFDEGDERSPFGRIPRLDVSVLNAIIAQARTSNLPSVVHIGSVSQIPLVLAARPDELQHVPVSPIPDSLVRALAAAGVAVTPTIAPFAEFLPPQVLNLMYGNVRRLAQAGVALIAGSDAPLGPRFGTGLHDEMKHLVAAGLTPAEALAAATRSAARALRRSDLGTLEPGKRADIVLLAQDPLASIENTRTIIMVFQDGRLVHR